MSAESAITGFALTLANYEAVTELLKRCYEERAAIQRMYINDRMNIEP